MREAILLLMIVAGLSGCASRNPGSREQYHRYTDSISQMQLDTSCLQYNRKTLLHVRSGLKEFSFSPPDSIGHQYVERIVYATEEWGVADSTEMEVTASATSERQEIHSSLEAGKEVVKQKTNYTVRVVIGLVLVSFLYLLWKTN